MTIFTLVLNSHGTIGTIKTTPNWNCLQYIFEHVTNIGYFTFTTNPFTCWSSIEMLLYQNFQVSVWCQLLCCYNWICHWASVLSLWHPRFNSWPFIGVAIWKIKEDNKMVTVNLCNLKVKLNLEDHVYQISCKFEHFEKLAIMMPWWPSWIFFYKKETNMHLHIKFRLFLRNLVWS